MHFFSRSSTALKISATVAISATMLATLPLAAQASTTTPRQNAKCARVNQTVTASRTVYRCALTKQGKRVWRVQKTATSAQVRATRSGVPTTSKTTSIGTYTLSSGFTTELAVERSSEPTTTTASGTSSYPVVPDPDNGGSPEVVYPDPSESERPNPALPARVSSFEIQTLGETVASFSLTPTVGISSYQVYVRHGDSFTLKGIDDSNPIVSFTDLAPDWAYTACAYYFVDSMQSEKSCLDFRTLGSRPAEPTPASGPSSVTASATETTITVDWSPVANARWYLVCHTRVDSMQCGGYTMLTDTSAIFQDGSVNPGWDYTISVQAVFADGSRSLESKTTVRSAGSQPSAPTLLAGATNFRVVSVTPTTATVAWDYSDSSALTVWSVIARHKTSYTSIGVDPAAREFTITNLAPGLGYEFTITGRNDTHTTEAASTNALMPTP